MTNTRSVPAALPEWAGERILEVEDEREPLAQGALGLIEKAFPPNDRQPLRQIAMEIAEKRMGLLTSYDFHLLAGVSEDGAVMAVAAGVYLGGVNAGFVTYLAVLPEFRSRQLGRRMRMRLVECFRRDARDFGWDDVHWVVGEVRHDSPWLRRLVRERAVVPFDLLYLHPGVEPGGDTEWILYRQPVGDDRLEIPAQEVRQLLYAIWRRAYRVRWPLERPGFQAMLRQIAGRALVGAHPAVMG